MQVSDLPKNIQFILSSMNISTLYPPQQEALPKVLNGQNVVLSIPTAAGKSLVAYLAIVNRLSQQGGKALYVVPLRALAREKYEELKRFEQLGFRVGITTGELDEVDRRVFRADIIVCTSEKADSLMRHDRSWIEKIQVLVIDEIHLIHDAGRGPTLEVIISHFRAMNPKTQIVALSATIANALELSDWLDAQLIQSDWRPVTLREGVYFQKHISYDDGSDREFSGAKTRILEALVVEPLSDGGQSLVFVNNRRSTVSVAQKIAPVIAEILSKDELQALKKLAHTIKKERLDNMSIQEKLCTCVSQGVAFHNAGLSSTQRRTVETGFKDRLIKCIVATPTLAAGVNIPARRVIVRDLWRYDSNFGMVPIPILEYKQQAGRAGRPGYDTKGEAITIAKNQNQRDQIFYNYILADTEPILSKFGNQASLRMHLLAAIASHFVHDMQQIKQFVESTFYAYQSEGYSLEHELETTVDFLKQHEFIEEANDSLIATQFGARTSALYIDPLSAVQLKISLEESCRKPTTSLSFLHAVCATPDIRSLYLRGSDTWIEEQAEHNKKHLLLKVPDPTDKEHEWFLSDLKTAMLLQDWIDELPYDQMVTKYNIWPGDIHNLVENSEWLLHATREFARMYNNTCLSEINDLVLRVHNGIKHELLNLIKLKGIGRVRARALYKEEFKTINDLRGVPLERIAQVKTIGKAVATSIKKQLNEYDEEKTQELVDKK